MFRATMRSSTPWKSTLPDDRPEEAGPMDDLLIFLGYTAAILLILGIGGLVADYVFPHIPFIERFIDSLPEWDDEE